MHRRHTAARSAAIFAAAIGIAAVAPAAARDGSSVAVIDDSVSGEARVGRFDYIGHWQHVRGKRDGRWLGTSTRSTHTGDVAIVRFSGTRIRLYGVRGPSGGRAGLALDMESTGAPVDFYAPVIEPHVLIYESPVLEPGLHALSVAVWGLRDEHAHYYYVNIDDAEVETGTSVPGRTAQGGIHKPGS